MTLEEHIRKYIKEIEEDTLVSIRESIHNEITAAELKRLLVEAEDIDNSP